jgi:hypothetical protein
MKTKTRFYSLSEMVPYWLKLADGRRLRAVRVVRLSNGYAVDYEAAP